MEQLPDELKTRLPPLHAQEAEEDPMVYAHYSLPGTTANWYVCEGQSEGNEYLLFGFVTSPDSGFRCFLLSELQALRGPQGQRVELDLAFTGGRLTDVVPAPDL